MIEEKIRQLLMQYPQVIYGFTSIAYSSYASKYKSALVLAVPYGEQLTLQNYTEEKFENELQEAKRLIDEILFKLEEILQESKTLYYVPPMAQNNEEELVAPFSYKYAAVNAGLGWIGKNDVVVTEKYGPRIRLSAMLIDHEFTYGQKIVESKCPVACEVCVRSCPHKALRNVTWDIDALRDDIIDYRLCNQKRSLHMEERGRKNACGFCMVACPFGI